MTRSWEFVALACFVCTAGAGLAAGCQAASGGTMAATAGDAVATAQPADRDAESGPAIEIKAKVPKPEALIFTGKHETKYKELEPENSFVDKIGDPVKQPVPDLDKPNNP